MFWELIVVFVCVVFGGMGYILGVILGVVLFVIFLEFLCLMMSLL